MSQANGTSDCICRNRLERPPAELQSIGRLPVAGRNTLPGTDNHAADRWLEDARPCSARIGARTGNRTRHSDRRPDPAPGRKPGPPQIRRTRKQKRTRRTGGVARQTRDHLSRDTRGPPAMRMAPCHTDKLLATQRPLVMWTAPSCKQPPIARHLGSHPSCWRPPIIRTTISARDSLRVATTVKRSQDGSGAQAGRGSGAPSHSPTRSGARQWQCCADATSRLDVCRRRQLLCARHLSVRPPSMATEPTPLSHQTCRQRDCRPLCPADGSASLEKVAQHFKRL